MNLAYLRSRAKQYRNARDDQERQELLNKLAWHLNLIRAGESTTLDDQHRIFAELRRHGINANYSRSAQYYSPVTKQSGQIKHHVSEKTI